MATVNILLFSLLIVMTLAGSFGSYFFKLASGLDMKSQSKAFLGRLIIGGILYFSGAVLNIVLLMYLPYTIVFPLTSITYIWTFLLSLWLLNEKATFRKIAGLTLILAGSALLVL
ncbi:multidrug transporter [Jeotgalibacillus sp. ET6]|uniref:EamA family transporter n=1 Tax=Jeotgalibacillus sp. ET6 TaxID=3037260 RepID=UPI00241828B4|nr:EamA family transporter [Jeotgalibacillus sp. ET6]MDG5471550.1 multidrug transporter [Jeotgalibacillus sp. ET6]